MAWHEAITDEGVRGLVTTAGWHNQEPHVAIVEAVKRFTDAEAKLGMPAGDVIRMPKTPEDPAWAEVYNRLGVPADKTAYTFDAKFKNGTAIDDKTAGAIRDLAAEAKMTPAQAARVAQTLVNLADDGAAQEAQVRATNIGAADVALRAQWGQNYDHYKLLATRAAEALGMTSAMIDAVGDQVGVDKFMETLRGLGVRMGEPDLLRGDNAGGGTRGLTRDQAVARKDAVMRDQEWAKRFMSGDTAAMREMEDLNRIIVGVPLQR